MRAALKPIWQQQQQEQESRYISLAPSLDNHYPDRAPASLCLEKLLFNIDSETASNHCALQDDFSFKEIKVIPSPKFSAYPNYASLRKLHLTTVINYNQDKMFH